MKDWGCPFLMRSIRWGIVRHSGDEGWLCGGSNTILSIARICDKKKHTTHYITLRLPVCKETCFPSIINEPEILSLSPFSSVRRHYTYTQHLNPTTNSWETGASEEIVVAESG